jgi:hypothetical protein
VPEYQVPYGLQPSLKDRIVDPQVSLFLALGAYPESNRPADTGLLEFRTAVDGGVLGQPSWARGGNARLSQGEPTVPRARRVAFIYLSPTRVLGQDVGKRSLEVHLYESGERNTGGYYLYTSRPDFPVLSYLPRHLGHNLIVMSRRSLQPLVAACGHVVVHRPRQGHRIINK